MTPDRVFHNPYSWAIPKTTVYGRPFCYLFSPTIPRTLKRMAKTCGAEYDYPVQDQPKQLNARERKRVEKLSQGNRLIRSLAIASILLREDRDDIPAGSRKDFRYHSYEEFFLKHGRLYHPQRFPPQYRMLRGKLGACLYNALLLAVLFPELDYVEGYAMLDAEAQVPMAHAWCSDAHGNVVDPTWSKKVGTEYFGMVMDKWLLTERHQKGEPFGLLFNWPLFSEVASGKVNTKNWRKPLAKRPNMPQ